MQFLKVFLRSDAGEIELSTVSPAPFKVLDGARGLGLPQRSIESTPLPSANGSVFRSGRFDESEVYLPVAMNDTDPSRVAERSRRLEHVLCVFSDDPIELVVEAPELSTVRRRYVYYVEGLEGAVGGEDSHFTWRHVPLKFMAFDPMWYGQERLLTQRVDAARKPFITKKLEQPAEGAVVHREDRAPTAEDPGSEGDTWFVGQVGRTNDVVLATNRLHDPSFEAGTDEWAIRWSGHISSVARTTNTWAVASGSYALQVDGTASSNSASSWIYKDFDVAGGEWVALAANMRHASSTPVSAQLGMYSYNTSGAILASDFGNTTFPVNSNMNSYDSSRYQLGAYRAPDNAVRVRVGVFFRASDGSSNPPPNFTAHMDDVDVAITVSEASALASVVEHFDGDTPDGATDNDPHYRWTGTPHASTSEKYLPATEFKPTDRYVHNGTEWEQVGLEKRAPFLPIVLASSTVDGAYQLNIQGDAEAWPIWEIDGPGEDLLIENVRTGERIFIEGEFGETVTIDTRPTVADIYSDTDQDGQLWERVADDYTLFPLTPGENRIKITMVNANPKSVVRLKCSETWLAGW